MSLLRPIFLLIVAWLVWFMFRRWKRDKETTFTHTPSISPPVHMVRCTHCGIHLPQRDALKKDDHWFCGRPHLEANRIHRRND